LQNQPRSNLSVYVDETMGRALGVTRLYLKGVAKLLLYTDADGSPDMPYIPKSDFVTMKGWVCDSVKRYSALSEKAICEDD
jgi:hypothetical protein